MMNVLLRIAVQTTRALASPGKVAEFKNVLQSLPACFTPDKFGYSEPIRDRFELDSAIEQLSYLFGPNFCETTHRNMTEQTCLIGASCTSAGISIKIGYSHLHPDLTFEHAVFVQVGEGRHADTQVRAPADILSFRPQHVRRVMRDGELKFDRIEEELPGWFERKCQEANCEWFVPMVKRMAAGDRVALEEIEASYRAHNGEVMPCGKWSRLVQ